MVEGFCGSKCGRLAGEKHGVDVWFFEMEEKVIFLVME